MRSIYYAIPLCFIWNNASIAIANAFNNKPSNNNLSCFAGFGGGGIGSNNANKKKSKKKKKGKKQTNNPNADAAPIHNLFTPQGRMDHIKERISSAAVDFTPIAKLALRKTNNQQLSLDIDPNAIVVVDNFLGNELITSMRAEAESFLPTMVPSQSTKWDEATQSIIPYEKKGVLSTQIEGGADGGYEKSPRLVEYIVTLTSHLSYKLNQILPDSYQLAGDEQTNKLAVCLGDGSYYDKHIDNLGGGETNNVGDRRKLTALLYIQPPGSHDGQPSYPNESIDDDPRGGYFRAYDVPEEDSVTCIAPRGDRLVVFWSDTLVHDVSPSFSPNGDADRRFALTIWFTADKTTGVIKPSDVAVEAKHFGKG